MEELGLETSVIDASPSYSELDNGQQLPDYFIATDTYFFKHKMNMFDYVGRLHFKSSYVIAKPKGEESTYRINLSLRGVQMKFGLNTTLLEINQLPDTSQPKPDDGVQVVLFYILFLEATKIYLNKNEQVQAKLERFDSKTTTFKLSITLIDEVESRSDTHVYLFKSVRLGECGVAIWSIVPITNLSLVLCKFFASFSTAAYSAEVCFFNHQTLVSECKLASKLLFQIFMATIALITLHPSCQNCVAEYQVPILPETSSHLSGF